MFKKPLINPALAAIIETLTQSNTARETFVVSDGESDTVRLVLRQGEFEIVLDVVAHVSPDGDHYHLDPCLTEQTCSELMSKGLLPGNLLDAMEQGSMLALSLTMAHRDRIIETVRRAIAS